MTQITSTSNFFPHERQKKIIQINTRCCMDMFFRVVERVVPMSSTRTQTVCCRMLRIAGFSYNSFFILIISTKKKQSFCPLNYDSKKSLWKFRSGKFAKFMHRCAMNQNFSLNREWIFLPFCGFFKLHENWNLWKEAKPANYYSLKISYHNFNVCNSFHSFILWVYFSL